MRLTQNKKVQIGFIFIMVMLIMQICLSVKAHAATLGKVKNLNVVVENNQVTLTWNKVSKANKYQVYRAAAKNGTYRLVKTTSARKWIDKGQKGIVWYKVRALKGKTKGTFSDKKQIFRAGGYVKSISTGVGSRIFKIAVTNLSSKHSMYFASGYGADFNYYNKSPYEFAAVASFRTHKKGGTLFSMAVDSVAGEISITDK